ncbi:hypothetical protein [Labilibaculum euxinus]
MKKNIIYILTIVILAFSACDPIENRHSLEPAKAASELEKTVNVSVDGNIVTCSTTNKDLIVYWEASNGWTGSHYENQFDAPLKGDYSLKATFLGGDKRVEVTKTFSVAADDPEFFSHPYWKLLAQNGDVRQKTWVWADDNDYAGGAVWGNGGWIGSSKAEWWTVTMDWFAENKGASAMDRLTFSMEGQLNFETEMSGIGQPGNGTGSWIMEIGGENVIKNGDAVWSEGSIKLTGHSIPCGITGDDKIQYRFWIVKLTEDELILSVPEGGANADAWSGAWFYHYKREGYVYP